MFRLSPFLLKTKVKRFGHFAQASRRRYAAKQIVPFHQAGASRHESVVDYLRKRNKIGKEQDITSAHARKVYEKIERQAKTMRFAQQSNNVLMGLQDVGDDIPLSIAAEHNLTPQEQLLHEDEFDYAMSAPPPQSFSRRLSQRVMEGKAWPSVPQSYELRSMTMREMEHESNMSPSARDYSEKILFHLMRNIKGCPSHLGEGIRFEELVLQRVVATRRSSHVYIVWSTITPSARLQMEPLLEKLNSWIVTLIKFNIKTTPNLPTITWVYDHGNLQTRLPRTLQKQLKNVYGDLRTSNKDRVEYLKRLDGLSHKMKDVPWFMPYLWSKEKKMSTRRAMGEDLRVVESRKNDSIGSANKPGFVS